MPSEELPLGFVLKTVQGYEREIFDYYHSFITSVLLKMLEVRKLSVMPCLVPS